jgi:16S rRNA (adenine1518-N6/adenine1519-N6)-dimethyltransferase
MTAQHPRAQLAQWGLRPKKRFGQNFLMDGKAAHRIARLCISQDEAPGTRVLEIGGGTGALTHALLEAGADVTVLEIDRDLVAMLRAREDIAPSHIVEADATTFDYASFAGDAPWRVAGNLPYNIATPLIMTLVEMERGPQSLTVMIQKDVAARLAAKPGTPAYGSLSVAVQYAMRVERAFTLGPNAFYPPPKVHSTVVQLTRLDEPAAHPRDLGLFQKVVRGAFAYRRKTLANSLMLALGYDRATVVRALEACSLAPEERGERLSLAEFAKLADALAEG